MDETHEMMMSRLTNEIKLKLSGLSGDTAIKVITAAYAEVAVELSTTEEALERLLNDMHGMILEYAKSCFQLFNRKGSSDWELIHPNMTYEHLGFLPVIFSEDDPSPAREQVNKKYAYGGGWNPQSRWTVDAKTLTARYPGDEPLQPIAKRKLHDETVVLYEGSYVAVIQPDGSFEVARMD
jgi:hypothetical protein